MSPGYINMSQSSRRPSRPSRQVVVNTCKPLLLLLGCNMVLVLGSYCSTQLVAGCFGYCELWWCGPADHTLLACNAAVAEQLNVQGSHRQTAPVVKGTVDGIAVRYHCVRQSLHTSGCCSRLQQPQKKQPSV